MSSTSPPGLISQSFIADRMPEQGPGVTEAARLHAALFGAYECVLTQGSPYQFSGAVLYNQSPQSDGQAQFSVKEDDGEPECTLTLQSLRDDFQLWLLELLPIDANLQPVEFRIIEAGARRRVIRYRHDKRPRLLKIKVSGVNAIDTESVTVCLWAGDMPIVHFDRSVTCVLDRDGPVGIDLLDNPNAEPRGLDERMRTLFHHIFFDRVSERLLEVACSYRYRIIRGDTRASFPVLLSRVERTDQNLPLALSSAMKAWYRDTAPRSGSFVLALTVFATVDNRPLPALKLRELVLPSIAITDIKGR